MSKSSESKIDRLRRRINSRDQSSSDTSSTHLSRGRHGDDVSQRWEHDDEDFQYDEPEKKQGSFLNKLLIFSGLFFILAFAFAVYSIGFNSSVISPDNVMIEIDGPTAISAGDTIELEIDITNDNKVLLQDAELVITYPDGTRQSGNNGQELTRIRENLGVIPSGDTVRHTAESSMFGEEGDRKTVEVSLEYRVQDSNAIFSADTEHEIEISEAPISVSIESPTEVTANEPFTLEMEVRSNASRELDDVVLETVYPFGFEATELDPDADFRDFIWELGDFEPGDEERIEVTGLFTDSSSSDEKAFRFDVGTARSDDSTAIGTLFASEDVTVQLREPFINVATDINAKRIANGNNLSVSGKIDWQSNLDTTVQGGEVSVSLLGDGIAYSTLDSDSGLYRSNEQAIMWNARTNRNLESISPGDSGSMRFSFDTQDSQLLVESIENPTVDMLIEMQAQTPDSSSLPNPITTTVEREIRLPSVLNMTIDTLYDDGPFTNTGPVPPEVNETTSYTLHLSLSNTTNEIEDASFQAALPAYVEIVGSPSPGSAHLDYNDVSGRLSWDIGTIPAGAGYTSAPKEIFIPIEVRPAPRHTDAVLQLLEDISISGTDTHTEESIQVRDIAAPTTKRDDLRANGDTGRVEN